MTSLDDYRNVVDTSAKTYAGDYLRCIRGEEGDTRPELKIHGPGTSFVGRLVAWVGDKIRFCTTATRFRNLDDSRAVALLALQDAITGDDGIDDALKRLLNNEIDRRINHGVPLRTGYLKTVIKRLNVIRDENTEEVRDGVVRQMAPDDLERRQRRAANRAAFYARYHYGQQEEVADRGGNPPPEYTENIEGLGYLEGRVQDGSPPAYDGLEEDTVDGGGESGQERDGDGAVTSPPPDYSEFPEEDGQVIRPGGAAVREDDGTGTQ